MQLESVSSFTWYRCVVADRKWKPGQPDNWTHGHEEGEDCAGLIHNANWNDFYCTDRIGFICERASDCQYLLCITCLFFTLKLLLVPRKQFLSL